MVSTRLSAFAVYILGGLLWDRHEFNPLDEVLDHDDDVVVAVLGRDRHLALVNAPPVEHTHDGQRLQLRILHLEASLGSVAYCASDDFVLDLAEHADPPVCGLQHGLGLLHAIMAHVLMHAANQVRVALRSWHHLLSALGCALVRHSVIKLVPSGSVPDAVLLLGVHRMTLARLLALVLRRVARTSNRGCQHGKACGNRMEARLWGAMVHCSKRLILIGRERVSGKPVRIEVLDTLARFERDFVTLEQIRPSSVHPAEPFIRHQPSQRFMVGHQREGSSVQVDPGMLNCPDSSKALSLVATLILLSSIATTEGICDHILAALIVSLNENGAQPNGTPVDMELERAAVIRPPKDRGLGQLDLQLLKGLLAGLVPVPRGAKLEQPVQRGTNV
jgi:hypothetical protein